MKRIHWYLTSSKRNKEEPSINREEASIYRKDKFTTGKAKTKELKFTYLLHKKTNKYICENDYKYNEQHKEKHEDRKYDIKITKSVEFPLWRSRNESY